MRIPIGRIQQRRIERAGVRGRAPASFVRQSVSRRFTRFALVALLCSAAPLGAQSALQTDADHYTRYELLAPGSAKFRIIYEVTATTPGATRYFNPIRKGSIATDEAVFDRMTGEPLPFEVVSGRVARDGGVRGADTTGEYIMVKLARPVPKEGEGRIRIDKTYEDARSYVAGADTLVYTRPLGIKKNVVVLPERYELTGVNYPSQVRSESDGRIAVSFMNVGPAEVPYVVRARRTSIAGAARGGPPAVESTVTRLASPNQSIAPATVSAAAAVPAGALLSSADVAKDPRLSERAHQDREIVYSLQPPETHAFDLYHDYTESRPGVDKYLNVVRSGSRVSRPGARILDTGESLETRTLRGAEITSAGIDVGQAVTPETEVVVIDFRPVTKGKSVRLRISETYTDPARYGLVGGVLVWDRAFGRPANAMILPAGWALTNCSVPATVTMTGDGRVRLDLLNPRNDDVSVLVTAVRR